MVAFEYEDIPEILRLIADMLENPPPDGGGTTDPLPQLRLVA